MLAIYTTTICLAATQVSNYTQHDKKPGIAGGDEFG